jgi:hypothetical protein
MYRMYVVTSVSKMVTTNFLYGFSTTFFFKNRTGALPFIKVEETEITY